MINCPLLILVIIFSEDSKSNWIKLRIKMNENKLVNIMGKFVNYLKKERNNARKFAELTDSVEPTHQQVMGMAFYKINTGQ